jgi:hypothetical protein
MREAGGAEHLGAFPDPAVTITQYWIAMLCGAQVGQAELG